MPLAAREQDADQRSGTGLATAPITGLSLRDLVLITRPQQWTKNLVVFAALIFSKHLFEIDHVLLVLAGFACFCLVASGCYVINDLRDCERDRQHPLKSLRPLPAGRMSRQTARLLALILMGTGLVGSFILHREFFLLITLYAVLQLAYSFVLKDMVILDVMVIATGFVIRAIAGGVIISVPVSQWLIICTFLGALFLGFCKRRHELVLLEGRATDHREALREYSPYFLDQMISVVTASTVVAYAIYTASPEVRDKLGTDRLYLTIPFVLFGIFRYLYLVHQREEGGNPTQVLLTDRPLLADMLLWIVTATLLLYWG
jgi:4-hydroxybenzoate polyprenyltransferase